MSLLWMFVIVAAAALLSLRPLWARPPNAGVRRRALNVVSYRQRLDEIDGELETGTLDADAAQALRDEAAARLLADTGDDPSAPAAPSAMAARPIALLLVCAVLIAAISALGYRGSESRRIAGWIAAVRDNPEAGQRLMVEGMVKRLERRLQEQPGDADGWAMLGRSYLVQDRTAESAQAYERANRLSAAAPRAEWLAAEAEVRVLLQDRDLQGLPRQLFERALAIDPTQGNALWYGGLAAAQAGEYGLALDRWLVLRGLELPDDFRAVLESQLPELAHLAGRALPERPAEVPLQLTVDIAVADSLTAEVDPGAVLYVFARNAEVTGGPPLAVRRSAAGELPLQLTLDDRDAMASGMGLSMAERWEVVARVSRSGNAQPQPGDLEGRTVVGRAQLAQPVRLQIDRRLP